MSAPRNTGLRERAIAVLEEVAAERTRAWEERQAELAALIRPRIRELLTERFATAGDDMADGDDRTVIVDDLTFVLECPEYGGWDEFVSVAVDPKDTFLQSALQRGTLAIVVRCQSCDSPIEVVQADSLESVARAALHSDQCYVCRHSRSAPGEPSAEQRFAEALVALLIEHGFEVRS